MRGDDQQRTAVQQILDHRSGEGGPFLRIGSRSELVQQHERTIGRSFENALEPHEIGGESRKMLEETLIIADQDVQRVDDRNHRAVESRHGQSAHGHGHDQPRGFQRDRFSAGVGTTDDECRLLRAQFDVDGDNTLTLGLLSKDFGSRGGQSFIEQGMSRVDQMKDVVVVE